MQSVILMNPLIVDDVSSDSVKWKGRKADFTIEPTKNLVVEVPKLIKLFEKKKRKVKLGKWSLEWDQAKPYSAFPFEILGRWVRSSGWLSMTALQRW